jgi:hypothetical protein
MVCFRRKEDRGQPAEKGPMSDPKGTFDETALTGSSCLFSQCQTDGRRSQQRALAAYAPSSYSVEMSIPVWSGMNAADARVITAQPAM